MKTIFGILMCIAMVCAASVANAATGGAISSDGGHTLLAILTGSLALGMAVGNATGTIKHTLSTGSSDVPTFGLGGGETQFYLGSARKESNGLALKALCIEMLITGSFVQAGGLGVRVFWDNFLRGIIANIEVRDGFTGTLMASRNMLGAYLPLVDYMGNAMRPGGRFRGSFPSAPGVYPFAFRVRIPLDHGPILKSHHLAPLAEFLRNAYLVVQYAQPSVLNAISIGSSLAAGSTIRAIMRLLPESEITVGPAHEWADYQVAVSNGNVITLKGFGASTGFSGVETPAAIDTALLLTSVNGLGGPFTADQVIQYGFETRGQQTITDIGSMYTDVIDTVDQRSIGNLADQGGGNLTDWSGFPYQLGTDPANAFAENQPSALFLPLIFPASRDNVELTKIQQFSGVDEDVQLTIAAPPPPGGSHHCLTHQIKRWTPAKLEEMRGQIINSGLAKKVLGTDNVDWEIKVARKQSPLDLQAKKLTYLPHRLVPKAQAGEVAV